MSNPSEETDKEKELKGWLKENPRPIRLKNKSAVVASRLVIHSEESFTNERGAMWLEVLHSKEPEGDPQLYFCMTVKSELIRVRLTLDAVQELSDRAAFAYESAVASKQFDQHYLNAQEEWDKAFEEKFGFEYSRLALWEHYRFDQDKERTR